MKHSHYVLLSFFLTIACPHVHAVESKPLICRPVASKENSLPEICTNDSFRDELVNFMNLSELYLLEADSADSRFVDRVELVPDLTENRMFIGRGKVTLRLNSFLRVRDAREFLKAAKARLSLVKASSETDRLFKKLALRAEISHLNMNVALNAFLDAPFLGEAGQVLAAVDDTALASTTKALTSIDPQPVEALSAVTDKDCSRVKSTLAQTKIKLERELTDLNQAREKLAADTTTLPNKKDKVTPVELASAIEKSDCDLCFDAVYHCKSKGLLKGTIPTEGNCRAVALSKECTASLPPLFAIPVELCRGTAPSAVSAGWLKHETEMKKKILLIEATLNRPGIEGCVMPAHL